jgi:hypothetical protein
MGSFSQRRATEKVVVLAASAAVVVIALVVAVIGVVMILVGGGNEGGGAGGKGSNGVGRRDGGGGAGGGVSSNGGCSDCAWVSKRMRNKRSNAPSRPSNVARASLASCDLKHTENAAAAEISSFTAFPAAANASLCCALPTSLPTPAALNADMGLDKRRDVVLRMGGRSMAADDSDDVRDVNPAPRCVDVIIIVADDLPR